MTEPVLVYKKADGLLYFRDNDGVERQLQYVGETVSSTLDMNNYPIVNLGDPVDSKDAAHKSFVLFAISTAAGDAFPLIASITNMFGEVNE